MFILISAAFCASGMLAASVISEGQQVVELKKSLRAYQNMSTPRGWGSKKSGVPEMNGLTELLHRINGYVGAHDMALREQYGGKAVRSLSALSDAIRDYRLLVKNKLDEVGDLSVETFLTQLETKITELKKTALEAGRAAGKISPQKAAAALYHDFFTIIENGFKQIKKLLGKRALTGMF